MERATATVREWLLSHEEAISKRDPAQVLRAVTVDCKRTFSPPNFLKLAGMSADFAMGNDVFEKMFTGFVVMMEYCRMEVFDMVIDTPSRKAVVQVGNHTKMKGEDKKETTLHSVFFLTLNEDLTKVAAIKQFVDPVSAEEQRDERLQFQKEAEERGKE